MSSMQIDRLLDTVVKTGASDLHLTVGRQPTIRLSGGLRNLQTKVLDSDDMVGLMKSITPERNQQELQEEGGTDFGFAYGDAARFRVSVFRQRGDLALVLRQIPNRLLTFEQIGLPDICKDLIRRPRGLFLVTGPTGSGKTTSMATMIDYINMYMDHHIITMEDPIEYYHQHKKSIVNQREVGNDVPSFAEALRRALRQDPDVILVGEMRDLETISLAVTCAEMGNLVFGTLHTNSAGKTIDRMIDVFPEAQQAQVRTMLATSLIGVCAQLLLRRTDGRGRVPVNEILIGSPALGAVIREGAIHKVVSYIESGRGQGMQLMDDSILQR
ncbi:MAG: PilT/PilU family type 4a pilus ATPase, partial [Planctomycetota bacterium]